ncbi:MAG: beta-galactosidase [Bacteroidetes bacterium]|nr:beta-galactosidase [Bacteroidota bacterium]
MKKLLIIATFVILLFQVGEAQQSWQQINNIDSKSLATHFMTPPPEYGLILWWGWDGPVNEEVIKRDLDKIRSIGFKQVMIEAGYGMTAPYLSTGWFELVKIAVEQARLRGMRVWVEDEGKYPSGFAGGKFSAERPDLKMQGLILEERFEVTSGQKIERKLSPSTLSAIAINQDDSRIEYLKINDGKLEWTPISGKWNILLVASAFKTSQTRNVNNITRGKDTSASLFDYLNPEATKQFLAWTHEQYKKYVGAEFGKTFMGIMGDEPDFAYTPWTPKMLNEFKRRKGYDIQPYLASFFVKNPPEEARRAKADYWDVWSSLFSENFFTIQADWCAQNKIEYIVHLNHEEKGPELVKSEGDYFKNMRHVGIPGVDAIWSQIWMDHEADYPKLASSAAHNFGRPRAFTESFAAYSYRPTVPQAKWVIDYQLVRGINMVQIMFMASSAQKAKLDSTKSNIPFTKPSIPAPLISSFFMSDTFPPVASYVNRATYLLSQGKPAAQIALYFPTSSMWLGDIESNESNLAIVQKLLETQHDFDFIDEQALTSLLINKNGKLTNLSGQSYSTVIIPSITTISQKALETLKAFSASGGKVIFLGKSPFIITKKTFLNAKEKADLAWALHETSGQLTVQVLKELPLPDVKFEPACPFLKYLHRKMTDGDLYFFFNESDKKQIGNIILTGNGEPQRWDATTGKIESIKSSFSKDGHVSLSLSFEPYETTFIFIHLN